MATKYRTKRICTRRLIKIRSSKNQWHKAPKADTQEVK
jgi:hypothetical protein